MRFSLTMKQIAYSQHIKNRLKLWTTIINQTSSSIIVYRIFKPMHMLPLN